MGRQVLVSRRMREATDNGLICCVATSGENTRATVQRCEGGDPVFTLVADDVHVFRCQRPVESSLPPGRTLADSEDEVLHGHKKQSSSYSSSRSELSVNVASCASHITRWQQKEVKVT
jgi:hypothetical protein